MLLYARVAGYPFIYFDDDHYVFDNEVVRRGLTLDNVRWAFTTIHFGNWHPFTWLSHMLDVELFGLDAGKHHLASALLHAANAVLLFIVLRRLTCATWRSALVAALFAVHPLHVESVAWVSERKDVLGTLFGLMALGAWQRYSLRPGVGAYTIVALLFSASLLVKPMWVTFPCLLMLLDWWPLQRLRLASATPGGTASGRLTLGRALAEKLPLLVLSGACAAVTVVAQARGGAMDDVQVGFGGRLGNALVAYSTYLFKSLWPHPLAIFYPYPVGGLSAVEVGCSVAAMAMASGLAIAFARRRPWLIVGWLWFLGTLVPVIGLIQVGGQAMADRYMYMPIVGLFIALVWGIHGVRSERTAAALEIGAVAVLLALSVVTWTQLTHWSSHQRLFEHAIEVTEANSRAHSLLVQGFKREGRSQDALAHAQEAVAIDPACARCWNNLGVAWEDVHHLKEASEAYGRAVYLDRSFAQAWSNLAAVMLKLGRAQAAASAAREAVRLEPNSVLSWSVLGMVQMAAGRKDEAARAYEAASQLAPGDWRVWLNLGVNRVQAGRLAEAILAFREALRLRPDDPDLLRRLAEAEAAARK